MPISRVVAQDVRYMPVSGHYAPHRHKRGHREHDGLRARALDPPLADGEREDCRGLTEFQISDSEDLTPLWVADRALGHETRALP
jgi:hypothetical protein